MVARGWDSTRSATISRRSAVTRKPWKQWQQSWVRRFVDGAVYRERIPNERLQAVVHVVRAWPGNIRQLINVIERDKNLADGHVITLHDLPSEITESASADAKNHDEGMLAAIERALVLEMRDQEHGHKTRTAKT